MTKSDKVSHAIGSLSILVMIVIAIVAASASNDNEQNNAKNKIFLEYSIRDVFSTPSTISENSSPVEISLRYKGREIENGSIVDIDIRNLGKTPIRPEDTYEPINIQGGSGLQIVNVEARGGISTDWAVDEKGLFKTKPLLINPSDRIGIRVFLKPTTSISKINDVKLKYHIDELGKIRVEEYAKVVVNARVAGLSKIVLATAKPISKPLSSHWYFVPFTITLWSWSIPFLVISFLSYLWFYMNTAYRLGWMKASTSRSLGIILSSASLSLWAAEAGASILQRSFPNIGGTFGGSPLSMNLPPVVINVLLVSFLLWKLHKLDSSGAAIDLSSTP